MKRKLISILIMACLLCTASVPAFGAETANTDVKRAETKSAQTSSALDTATGISLGTSYSGNITNEEKLDYYRFTLADSGAINLKGTLYMQSARVTVFNAAGEEVWREGYDWNSTTQQISLNETIHLTSGTYYICLEKYWGEGSAYNFQLDYTSANESFKEYNGGSDNSLNSANAVDVNTAYRGQIASNDEKDYYKFTLTNSGAIDIKGTLYMKTVYITVFDSEGQEIWDKGCEWNDTTQQISLDKTLHLTSGTYYICFENWIGRTGNYNFRLDYTSAGESFPETNGGTNNDIPSASDIALDRLYYGQIADNDEKDFYRFSAPSAGKIQIRLSSYADLRIALYDADGEELASRYESVDSNKNRWDYNWIIELEKTGTYYFCAGKSGDAGNYSFSISKFSPSVYVKSSFKKKQDDSSFSLDARTDDENADLIYTSSNEKVVTVGSSGWVYIEGPGIATITVRAEGTSIKKNVKITVLPSRPNLYSVTGGKRSLKAQWYRNDKASGYQVLMATNRSFTKNKQTALITKNRTTAKIFKGLKKNTRYYVKVRAYKTAGGTKLYGAYSSVGVVKVK